MSNLKNELTQLQHLVKTYEEHNLKIPELEKKLRSQKAKYEKEIKTIETFYKEKLKAYSHKLNLNETENKMISNHSTINNQSHYKTKDLYDDQDRVNVRKYFYKI
jgi:DUF438 domain-containing protein